MTIKEEFPCRPDSNVECLVCDEVLGECAYMRMLEQDYTKESEDELKEIFKDFLEGLKL